MTATPPTYSPTTAASGRRASDMFQDMQAAYDAADKIVARHPQYGGYRFAREALVLDVAHAMTGNPDRILKVGGAKGNARGRCLLAQIAKVERMAS